jgi:UDP-N-acetylmuramoyl-tripeptide--D-alanyl-D-alanine ligase
MIDAVTAIVAIGLVASWLMPVVGSAKRSLHILQLEEYQTRRFWRWIAANAAATIDPWIIGAALVVILAQAITTLPLAVAPAIVAAALGVWQSRTRTAPPAKKPLVITARVKRLIAGYVVCALLVAAAITVTVLGASAGASPALLASALTILVLSVLAWPLASLANLLLFPVEAGFRAYYARSAAHILRSYAPTVVGVAGSYGKTSTKTFLAHLLAARYATLATPRSFNTPMGLCRVIREQLRSEHRFFVAELGAYERGEIRQLCRLVHPTIGILTSVGPEHLERFGSMENVVLAESELFEALPPSGYAIVNGGDPLSREIAGQARCTVDVVGGSADDGSVLWAEDVAIASTGLRFRLCHRDGWRRSVATRLLGRHNVGNILLASAAALRCGLDVADLVAAIESLKPVEHRLELVPNDNGVVVIDDTYNSNPSGAAAALEALASFAGGRRILVTPGMVELAELQDDVNQAFGQQAAGVCDHVILVGPRRTKAIAAGLAAAGFDPDRLTVAKSLADATDCLRGLLRPGDAVLFENDLPDNYSE